MIDEMSESRGYARIDMSERMRKNRTQSFIDEMSERMRKNRGRPFIIFIQIFLLFSLFHGTLHAQIRPDALVEYRNGNYERSVEICKNELAVNANNIESHVVICWSLIRLGRYAEAADYAQTGRRISRYDVRIIEILGEVCYYRGQNNEAIQYFQEYINQAPEGVRIDTVYYFLGEVYIRMGRFRLADIALTAAVHWVPGNAVWWTRLAYARESAGDLREAITAYEKALSLDPQTADARRGLERARQALPR